DFQLLTFDCRLSPSTLSDNRLDHGVRIAPALAHLVDVAVDRAVAQSFGYHLLKQSLAKQFEQPDPTFRLLPLDAQGARLAENAEPVERLAKPGDAFRRRGHRFQNWRTPGVASRRDAQHGGYLL